MKITTVAKIFDVFEYLKEKNNVAVLTMILHSDGSGHIEEYAFADRKVLFTYDDIRNVTITKEKVWVLSEDKNANIV